MKYICSFVQYSGIYIKIDAKSNISNNVAVVYLFFVSLKKFPRLVQYLFAFRQSISANWYPIHGVYASCLTADE